MNGTARSAQITQRLLAAKAERDAREAPTPRQAIMRAILDSPSTARLSLAEKQDLADAILAVAR